ADAGGKPDTASTSDNAGDAATAADDKPDAADAVPATGGTDSDGDGMSDAAEQQLSADVDVNAADADGDGTPDAQEDGDIDNDGVPDAQEEDPPTDPFDADGDGKLEPDEIADRKEFAEVFDDIPNEPDEAALDARAEDAELAPSMTVEDFRKAVRIVKKIVLGKMALKIAKKSDQRMVKFSWMVFGLSLCGLLLLAMPLVLAKKYPGQGKLLLKYSALAAATFFVTVNLFGGVLFGLRTVQGALSNYTNPSIAIAEGTFDTLDRNADEYVVTGKELFAPTLEQMRNHPDEQPAVLLIENGMKIVKDARVFMSMANLFKNVDFVFGVLPIILTFVTLLLFLLAIKPTLIEIVKVPAAAAMGNASAGRDVVGKSVHRVKSELFATACTVGVLVTLTLVSSFVLGKIVGPALDALLGYFSAAVQYLQFVEGASSGLVFVTLFGVILFLVLNLAALILSMSFFLGKSQKIFQARFTDGEPLANHRRFFRWGVPSVLLVQLFPLVFVFIAGALLGKINDSLLAGVTDAEAVPWTQLLLAGPAFLVIAFAVLFWAARGFKAIKFLQGYKVKSKTRRPAASAPAQPLPPS
ncbi:MAG: hypothetical protein H0T89_20930, partial [Deltaproteobacteria bacterium]|nr:hypothetical protein [Deltaproteobacteria bacterium]